MAPVDENASSAKEPSMNRSFRQLLPLLLVMGWSSAAHAVDIRVSAFGDVTAGITAGDPANAEDAANFDKYGDDIWPVNTNSGVGTMGTDFIMLADLTNNLTWLGEINFQALRDSSTEYEVDVERFLVDYRVNQALNIQTGLFFTPIGLYNRFLYSRAWLVNSIQIPDMFEEEFNFAPSHTSGIMVHGGFFAGGSNTINYAVSVGNGRHDVPDETTYARDATPFSETAGLVELLVPGFKTSRVGVSGWTDTIETFKIDDYNVTVDVGDPVGFEEVRMRDVGFNPFVSLETRYVSLFGEYVFSHMTDLEGNLPEDSYDYHGAMAELSFHVARRKVHPYVRFDMTKLPEDGGGPFLSLRGLGGNDIHRVWVPETTNLLLGSAFDVHKHARLKAEYGYFMNGPRPMHAITTQVAYGF
jgi:hypothetical protein